MDTGLTVDIRIIYGKTDLDPREQQWLNTVPHIRTSFCKNLHAKCYLNESVAVITSLNLHLYSQQNNNEMGVMVKRRTDQQIFFDIAAEVDRLLRISEPTHADRENLVLRSQSQARIGEPEAAYAKLTTAKLATKLGVQSTRLFERLIGHGYLELRDGGKHYLTAKGKSAGGEFRTVGKGPFFVWPSDLEV